MVYRMACGTKQYTQTETTSYRPTVCCCDFTKIGPAMCPPISLCMARRLSPHVASIAPAQHRSPLHNHTSTHCTRQTNVNKTWSGQGGRDRQHRPLCSRSPPLCTRASRWPLPIALWKKQKPPPPIPHPVPIHRRSQPPAPAAVGLPLVRFPVSAHYTSPPFFPAARCFSLRSGPFAVLPLDLSPLPAPEARLLIPPVLLPPQHLARVRRSILPFRRSTLPDFSP